MFFFFFLIFLKMVRLIKILKILVNTLILKKKRNKKEIYGKGGNLKCKKTVGRPKISPIPTSFSPKITYKLRERPMLSLSQPTKLLDTSLPFTQTHTQTP